MEIRLLSSADASILERVAEDVFDHAPERDLIAEFLSSSNHHIAVCVDDGVVVGFASALHYVHPDKPPQLWLNEFGVAPTHRRRGLGSAMLTRLLELAQTLGCTEAWVLTDEENTPARAFYGKAGGRDSRSVMVTFPVTGNLSPTSLEERA